MRPPVPWVRIEPPPPPVTPSDAPAPVAPIGAVDEGTSPPPPPPHRPDLAIAYDGRTGGATHIDAEIWVDLAWTTGPAPRSHGWCALYDDGRWLVPLAGGLDELRRALAGPMRWSERQPRTLWESDGNLVFGTVTDTEEPIVDPAALRPPLVPRQSSQWLGTTASGASVVLVDEAGTERPPPEHIDPTAWELRPRAIFDGGVVAVARGEGEGSRRVELVQSWRGLAGLYLSGGNAVEERTGSSHLPLATMRRLSWAALRDAGLVALAPAEAELRHGPERLREEAAEAGVHLLSANLVRPDGSPWFDAVRIERVAGRRVALIGWTDPEVVHRLSPTVRATARIRGPDALLEVLAALPHAFSERPDLVVLFGAGARALDGRLPGVDLVLGDFSAREALPRWESVDESALRARARDDPMARGPALVPRLGPSMVGRVDVEWADDGALVGLHHLRVLVTDRLPRSDRWGRAVQSLVQGAVASGEEVLLPPPERGDPGPRGEQALARSLAMALADESGADVVVLPRLSRSRSRGLAVLEVDIADALPLDDGLVALDVPARVLRQWITLGPLGSVDSTTQRAVGAAEIRGWYAGALEPAGLSFWVRGRLVRDDERIRVLTTSRLLDVPELSRLVATEKVERRFRERGLLRPSPVGASVRLDDAARRSIITARGRPDFFSDRLARPGPRHTIRAEGLGLALTGSGAKVDRESWAGSTEGRTQQQDALTVSGRGRLTFAREDAAGALLLTLNGAFGLSRLPGLQDPVELEDDLVAGIEARLLLGPWTRARAVLASLSAPVQLDTEWRRGRVEGAKPLPRQRVLRTTPSLIFGRIGFARELRAGALIDVDLGGGSPVLAPGVQVSAALDPRWGPIRLGASTDLRLYPPTRTDVGTEMGVWWTSRVEVGVEPARRLLPGWTLGGFADAFVFAGKDPERRPLGVHLLVGASIGWSGELRLGS